MKIKDYLNSLVSRRKSSVSTSSRKVPKPKLESQSISSTDGHYELCGYEDPTKVHSDDHHSRTQILLTRHAQLVNTIVGMRSSDAICPHCRTCHPPEQEHAQLKSRKNYSNTLATCNPRRECQDHSTSTSASNHSLLTQTRQRSRIRTNPWIKTTRVSQPEYSIYEPKTPPGLIHSESFPQTVLTASHFSNTPSNGILHQSDSGHGLSSCSPDENSSDGPALEGKQHLVHNNHQVKAMPSNHVNKPKHQHPSNIRISSPKRLPPSSPDRFSNPRSLTRNSPFILPLEDSNVKTTLKKTNSRTILKHIEEIENEIQMIKNLNLDQASEPLTLFSHENNRRAIHKQVDRWVEECLTTTTKNNNNTPTARLHSECDRLSDTIKDYVQHVTSSLPKAAETTEVMTAFYLSSIPTTKRTFSFIDQPLQSSKKLDSESIHECPF